MIGSGSFTHLEYSGLDTTLNPMPQPNLNRRKYSCLIVDDDAMFARMAAQVVRDEGGVPTIVADIASARQVTDSQLFDLILLDNHLPDGKGYEYYDRLARCNPNAPIVMITGIPDLGEAVNLTRNGLFDYLTKPVTVDALGACLRRAQLRLAAGNIASVGDEFFGDSSPIRELLTQLRQAAKHPSSTVLLTGETGAGKDMAARKLHQLTHKDENAPFIAVNCAALPADIFESELFGAERGAFTGADKNRGGLVAAAAGGTLFLDEIGEVPLVLQGKLLRLLDAREYRSLGSTGNQQFRGRFVAATNKKLDQEVAAGRFRSDLLYRLDVFSVELPPLRQRRSDIPGLAELLLSQLASRYDRAKPMLRPEDLSALEAHSFPGNVRELRNVLERSLLRTDDESKWLMLDLSWLNRAGATSPGPVATAATSPDASPGALGEMERNLTAMEAQEYRLIRDTLRKTNGGIRRAAALIGLSPQSLLRRLEKWPELRPPKE
ncbi:response regulator [bacterium]|nr:response regulator [bacterium]